MNPTSIGDSIKNYKPPEPATKADREHQAMMELVIKAGYAPKKYQGM